jgi:hypothetical protein
VRIERFRTASISDPARPSEQARSRGSYEKQLLCRYGSRAMEARLSVAPRFHHGFSIADISAATE